jgi:uncharacterized protein
MRKMSAAAALLALLTILLPTSAPRADSAADDGLYEARAILTGTRIENRAAGFREAFKTVLVKVAADDKLLADPRVEKMAAQAATYVVDFRYWDRMTGLPTHDEQGTRDRPYDLIVHFNETKIDEALRTLGRTPWTGHRPKLAVFLAMRTMKTEFVLASDSDRDLELESITQASQRRFMPMALPSQADLAKAKLDFASLPSTTPAALDADAKALGGEMALVGRMLWDQQNFSWTSEWRLQTPDGAQTWTDKTRTFDDAFRNAFSQSAKILSAK